MATNDCDDCGYEWDTSESLDDVVDHMNDHLSTNAEELEDRDSQISELIYEVNELEDQIKALEEEAEE